MRILLVRERIVPIVSYLSFLGLGACRFLGIFPLVQFSKAGGKCVLTLSWSGAKLVRNIPSIFDALLADSDIVPLLDGRVENSCSACSMSVDCGLFFL